MCVRAAARVAWRGHHTRRPECKAGGSREEGADVAERSHSSILQILSSVLRVPASLSSALCPISMYCLPRVSMSTNAVRPPLRRH